MAKKQDRQWTLISRDLRSLRIRVVMNVPSLNLVLRIFQTSCVRLFLCPVLLLSAAPPPPSCQHSSSSLTASIQLTPKPWSSLNIHISQAEVYTIIGFPSTTKGIQQVGHQSEVGQHKKINQYIRYEPLITVQHIVQVQVHKIIFNVQSSIVTIFKHFIV